MKRKVSRLSICFNIILTLLFSVGCTTPKALIPMDKAYSHQLIQHPTAVVVLAPRKKIVLAESLYRVFWIEYRVNEYTFENIWDPTQVLEEQWIKILQTKFNVMSIPLYEKVEPNVYRDLVKKLETSIPSNMRQMEDYFRTTSSEYRSLSGNLGIGCIFELTLMPMSIAQGPFGLYISVYARLVRLSDGAVLWLNSTGGYSKIGDVGNFSELEANNLKLLKQHYEQAVMSLFHPNPKESRGPLYQFGPLYLGLMSE